MPPAIEITDNIYQVHVPIPFPLVSINCYLVRDADGWTMIDTGLHHPPAFQVWQDAFDALKMSPTDLIRIVLTHAHPDHYGLAGYFQNLSGAPVYMLDREIEIVPRLWNEEHGHIQTLQEFFLAHGAPPDVLAQIMSRSRDVLDMIQPQPRLAPLHAGEELCLGGHPFRILWTPGHSDGHLLLHREQDGLAFVGDQVLNKITPNIGLWPHLDPKPLASYLASLDELEKLPVSLGLPGHRGLIRHLAERVREVRHHHQQRLEDCYRATARGATGYVVCRTIFPRLVSADDLRMAMVETLSHLVYLVASGRLEQSGEHPIRFTQITAR